MKLPNLGLKPFAKSKLDKAIKSKTLYFDKKALVSDTFERKAKSITEEEMTDAIRRYERSPAINHRLRFEKFLTAEDQKYIDTLDYAIATSKPLEKKVTAYRGIVLKDGTVEEFLNNNKGYTSCSTDKYIASEYSMGKNGAIVEIELGEGTKAIQRSYEYILGRNSKFKVEKIDDKLYRAKLIK